MYEVSVEEVQLTGQPVPSGALPRDLCAGRPLFDVAFLIRAWADISLSSIFLLCIFLISYLSVSCFWEASEVGRWRTGAWPHEHTHLCLWTNQRWIHQLDHSFDVCSYCWDLTEEIPGFQFWPFFWSISWIASSTTSRTVPPARQGGVGQEESVFMLQKSTLRF